MSIVTSQTKTYSIIKIRIRSQVVHDFLHYGLEKKYTVFGVIVVQRHCIEQPLVAILPSVVNERGMKAFST